VGYPIRRWRSALRPDFHMKTTKETDTYPNIDTYSAADSLKPAASPCDWRLPTPVLFHSDVRVLLAVVMAQF
jgi:hypothetical protein